MTRREILLISFVTVPTFRNAIFQNVDSNDIVTNHYDVVNNVSNSSLEEDDEPPPLPPPRGESLARSLMADLTPSPTENGMHLSFAKNKKTDIA